MEIKQSDEFENVVHKIFTKLLETFPKQISLEAEDIGITDDLPVEAPTTFGGAPMLTRREKGAEETFFDDCLKWLLLEEYVSGTPSDYGFSKVVLTHKGLAVLNAVPQCLISGFND